MINQNKNSFKEDSTTGFLMTVIEKTQVLPLYLEQDSHLLKEILKEIGMRATESAANQPETADGRTNLASIAYKVRRTKTYLDNLGKSLTEEWAKNKKLVDNSRKSVREFLDTLAEKIKEPVKQFEIKDDARKEKIQGYIHELISQYEDSLAHQTRQALEKNINTLNELSISEDLFQEFYNTAIEEREEILEKLNAQLSMVIERESIQKQRQLMQQEQDKRDEETKKTLAQMRETQRIKDEAFQKERLELENEKAELVRAKAEHEAELKKTTEQFEPKKEEAPREMPKSMEEVTQRSIGNLPEKLKEDAQIFCDKHHDSLWSFLKMKEDLLEILSTAYTAGVYSND